MFGGVKEKSEFGLTVNLALGILLGITGSKEGKV